MKRPSEVGPSWTKTTEKNEFFMKKTNTKNLNFISKSNFYSTSPPSGNQVDGLPLDLICTQDMFVLIL